MQDPHEPSTDDRERLKRYLEWREHTREDPQRRERSKRAVDRRRRFRRGIVVAAFAVGALGLLTWVSYRPRETGRSTELAPRGALVESSVTPEPTAPLPLERATPAERPTVAVPRAKRAAVRASRPVAPPDEVRPVAPADEVRPVAPADDVRPVAPADDVRTVAPSDDGRPVAPPEPVAPSAAPVDRAATSGVAAASTPPEERPGPDPSTGPATSNAIVARVKAESQEFRAGVKREIEDFRAGIDRVGRGLQWLGGKLRRSE